VRNSGYGVLLKKLQTEKNYVLDLVGKIKALIVFQSYGFGSGTVGSVSLDLPDPDPALLVRIRIRIRILPLSSKMSKTNFDV
jgi:hypothetical protein